MPSHRIMKANVTTSDAPAEAAPGWIRLMALIASRLPVLDAPEGTFARAVIAAPTTRHVAAAMAVSAMHSSMEDADAPVRPDTRVATVISKRFCDTEVRTFGQRLSIGGVQFDPQRAIPPAVILGEEWELERSPQSVPADAVAFAQQLGREGVPPEWTYLRFCMKPIVVIAQRPAQVAEDLADLAQQEDWWNATQRLGLASPAEGVDMWFRRPIILASPAALAGATWISCLPVSLVVIAGFAAWLAPQRNLWPNVPQVLLLNQRTSDIADFRAWFDGAQLPELLLPGAASRNLRKSGITITTFAEPIGAGASFGSDTEVDEWDF